MFEFVVVYTLTELPLHVQPTEADGWYGRFEDNVPATEASTNSAGV